MRPYRLGGRVQSILLRCVRQSFPEVCFSRRRPAAACPALPGSGEIRRISESLSRLFAEACPVKCISTAPSHRFLSLSEISYLQIEKNLRYANWRTIWCTPAMKPRRFGPILDETSNSLFTPVERENASCDTTGAP